MIGSAVCMGRACPACGMPGGGPDGRPLGSSWSPRPGLDPGSIDRSRVASPRGREVREPPHEVAGALPERGLGGSAGRGYPFPSSGPRPSAMPATRGSPRSLTSSAPAMASTASTRDSWGGASFPAGPVQGRPGGRGRRGACGFEGGPDDLPHTRVGRFPRMRRHPRTPTGRLVRRLGLVRPPPLGRSRGAPHSLDSVGPS